MKAELEAATGLRFRGAPQGLAVGGGFATCERWESDSGPVFVKSADRQRVPLLEAEAAGLRELASAAALRERFERLESRASADGREQWLNWVVRLDSGAIAGQPIDLTPR